MYFPLPPIHAYKSTFFEKKILNLKYRKKKLNKKKISSNKGRFIYQNVDNQIKKNFWNE